MRILHFGDIHFGMENYGRLDPKTGLHSRFGDFCKSFDAVIDYAIGRKDRYTEPINKSGPVDLVIFAGDAFKTRDPSPTYVKAFAQGIRRIADAGIPVVMIVGNHDLPNAAGKANTLDIFPTLAVPNVYLSREPEYLRIDTKVGPLQVVTLPWMFKSQLFTRDDIVGKTGEEINALFHDKIVKLFRLQLAKVDPQHRAVAVVHATVEGATFGSERSVLLGSDIVIPLNLLSNPKLSYVAIGHIHKAQSVLGHDTIRYSGSLERIDFGEEKEEKGFLLVTIKNTKTSVQFIPVPVRPFITITVDVNDLEVDPTTVVVNKVKRHKIDKAVVRVVIRCSQATSARIRETPIREALEKASFIAGIIRQIDYGSRLAEQKGYSDDFASIGPVETLEQYWKGKQVTPTRIERLKEAVTKLLETMEHV